MIQHVEHPPQACGDGPADVVVGDHPRVVADARRGAKRRSSGTNHAWMKANRSALTVAASVVGIPPVLVAGIYGMNFKNMPELEMKFGYHTVIVAIFALCGILYWRFRKNGWL